jgi:hypothetical protein
MTKRIACYVGLAVASLALWTGDSLRYQRCTAYSALLVAVLVVGEVNDGKRD